MRIARKAIGSVVPPHESPSADDDDELDESDEDVAEGEIVDEAEQDDRARSASAG